MNISILNTQISQNKNGLYSMNDLHRSAASSMTLKGDMSAGDLARWIDKKRPFEFLRVERTIEYMTVLERNLIAGHPPIKESTSGAAGGTFACRELLCRYGSWLSPELDVLVHRAFIASIEPPKMMTPGDHMVLTGQMMLDMEKVKSDLPVIKSDIKVIQEITSPLYAVEQGKIPDGYMNIDLIVAKHGLGLSKSVVKDYLIPIYEVETSTYVVFNSRGGLSNPGCVHVKQFKAALVEFKKTMIQVTLKSCISSVMPHGKMFRFVKNQRKTYKLF